MIEKRGHEKFKTGHWNDTTSRFSVDNDHERQKCSRINRVHTAHVSSPAVEHKVYKEGNHILHFGHPNKTMHHHDWHEFLGRTSGFLMQHKCTLYGDDHGIQPSSMALYSRVQPAGFTRLVPGIIIWVALVFTWHRAQGTLCIVKTAGKYSCCMNLIFSTIYSSSRLKPALVFLINWISWLNKHSWLHLLYGYSRSPLHNLDRTDID